MESTEPDVETPNSGRIDDDDLGGAHNVVADRDLADQIAVTSLIRR